MPPDVKVVLNAKHGGFSLSGEAQALALRKGLTRTVLRKLRTYSTVRTRSHPALVETVEELGARANGGDGADLRIVTIPGDVVNRSHIVDAAGVEWVAENHRTWSAHATTE